VTIAVNPMATAGPPRGNQLGRRDDDDKSMLWWLYCHSCEYWSKETWTTKIDELPLSLANKGYSVVAAYLHQKLPVDG
jgi:hypothetical protein